jgi:hypothetical protein
MLAVYLSTGTDVLVLTQEQVAVLSACDDLVRGAGVHTAVPSFEALSQVQDKLSAFATLTAAGLPQPEGVILATPADVAAWDRFPVDINPRLVEPANAMRAGVDLVTPMIELASGVATQAQPPSQAGVRTHQLLLAVLGAAQQTGRRRSVIAELAAAARHAGDYSGSTEELTPVRRDLRAAIPVVMAVAATVIHPASWRQFTSSSVASYSLSPAGWRDLKEYRRQRIGG